jgi:2-hydroxy-3-oxopropionate reductase
MQRVGFIGLGVMGRPMAQRLLAAGHDVIVHNRSRGAVDALVADGAAEANSPQQVAAGSDVVITVLPDAPDVEEVLLGSEGVLRGLSSSGVAVDMTTSTPELARRAARQFEDEGVALLDAPVSGGESGAISGALSIMVGGDAAALEQVRSVLEVMGTIVHVGDAGAGQIAKAANQMVVGGTIAVVAEALLFAEAAGVDPARVRDALLGGLAGSRILDVHGARMLADDYPAGFRSELHLKDLRIAMHEADLAGVALPATALVRQLFTALVAQGGGADDHAAIKRVLARLSSA